jgi:hypothetical protein
MNTETRQRIFNGSQEPQAPCHFFAACVGLLTIAKELRVLVSAS